MRYLVATIMALVLANSTVAYAKIADIQVQKETPLLVIAQEAKFEATQHYAKLFRLHGTSAGGSCSPASVNTAGLCAVLSLPTTALPRRVDYKIPGVDTYPGAGVCSDISAGGETYILCTGNATWGSATAASPGWNFSNRAGVIYRGNTTVGAIYDSLFSAGTCNNTRTNIYGLQVSDNATTPNITVGYTLFDGGKCNTSVGSPGPWAGAALYVTDGAILSLDHVTLTGIPSDPSKCSNSTLNYTSVYTQAFSWNQNADGDAPQAISCNFTVNLSWWDISDGAALAQAHNFPGVPANSAFYNVIDVPSSQNSTQTITNTIFSGFGGYGTACCTNFLAAANGLPFNTFIACDNHTVPGSPFTLNLNLSNVVIQKSNNDYTSHGGTMTSAGCLGTWTAVIDYDTGAVVPKPSF